MIYVPVSNELRGKEVKMVSLNSHEERKKGWNEMKWRWLSMYVSIYAVLGGGFIWSISWWWDNAVWCERTNVGKIQVVNWMNEIKTEENKWVCWQLIGWGFPNFVSQSMVHTLLYLILVNDSLQFLNYSWYVSHFLKLFLIKILVIINFRKNKKKCKYGVYLWVRFFWFLFSENKILSSQLS